MTLLERAACSTTDRSTLVPIEPRPVQTDLIVLPPVPASVPALEPEAPTMAPGPHGENLMVPERVITAPVAGLFEAAPAHDVTCEGEVLQVGQVIGSVTGGGERITVRSPFGGFFMGRLAHDGERVRPGQPLAWVRVITP